MNVLTNVLNFYNNGKQDVYHYVLGKILENTDLFLHGSIYEIADYCSSSTATISRLAQKLGYKNFSDFRHILFDAFHFYQYSNAVMANDFKLPEEQLGDNYFAQQRELLAVVEDTVRQTDLGAFADLLHRAKRVFFFSFNMEFTELPLQINLLMTGVVSMVCPRFSVQIETAKQLQPEDVVIIIAPDNSDALDVIPLSQEIQKHRATSLLLTNSTQCVHINRVDQAIAFDGTGTNLDYWGMYMILDNINMIYRKRYVDTTEDFGTKPK